MTSGLKTNFNPSLSYSAHKSLNTNHNIPTVQLFPHQNQTNNQTNKPLNASTKTEYFCSTVKKIFLHTEFTSIHLMTTRIQNRTNCIYYFFTVSLFLVRTRTHAHAHTRAHTHAQARTQAIKHISFGLSVPGTAPEGRPGCLMSPPCLESQGCHLIPLFYLLSCSSA